MSRKLDAALTEWWLAAAFRMNRRYALGVIVAALVAFGMPYALGPFVPCAEFMEVEWLMVALLCLVGLGLLNIAFTFAPSIEYRLPARGKEVFRSGLLVVIPVIVVGYSMWAAFSPFWYALFNNPVLLCD